MYLVYKHAYLFHIPDRKAAETLVVKFVDNLNADNFTAAGDLVATDAVFILPGIGVVEGKDGRRSTQYSTHPGM